jgi:multidrug resistance efflux pump
LVCLDISFCNVFVLQAEAAKAAELKGPHSLSFARLMAVYANLLAADENHAAAAGSSGAGSSLAAQQLQQMRGGAAAECGGAAAAMGGSWLGVQSADVMMGVKNLVASRLLTQVGCSGVVSQVTGQQQHCVMLMLD